ncbi:uncharacterized protein TNIN_222321 [Trichonephila inaurata madagascariensis]|uniref:Uncharacterized protein n=1 Tax=Trichonephila inaurata madagascariensis TaxID=2747483 RepID=A0A8X6XHP5_9ARAC|nr:uncharacterized protein TNIN_222321 [Trichonephila inaurata madagascariensis]
MSREKKTLTLEQIETIRSVCQTSRETNEMCLLLWLLIETNLKPRHLLGWFNQNQTSRNDYLQGKIVLPGGVLFSKRHHAYLSQFKRKCHKWIGTSNVSFEMLSRSVRNKMPAKKLSTRLKELQTPKPKTAPKKVTDERNEEANSSTTSSTKKIKKATLDGKR